MSKQNDRVVSIKGKKVILRPIDKDKDLPNLLRWINDPEIQIYLLRYTPIMAKCESEWIDSLAKDEHNIVFIIETLSGKPIGVMGLHGIQWKDRAATTGAFIGEKKFWNLGYGTDAKMILLDYAFNKLNLRKICSSVIAFNGRSLAYNRHCGYKVEGRRRKQIFKEGRYCDEILLGLFKRDWEPVWKRYQKIGKVK